ncbi:transcription factor p65-like isoform X1 [Lethenteron reissneri]|uniref:transcription factor p65-like isoform X1 n=1 Tax=Lethenteron reissneri TaxID=7753 RepID=UPI002AB698B4|nr:transcription factor p65-like isoform X1 [Lethenteron reissneri]
MADEFVSSRGRPGTRRRGAQRDGRGPAAPFLEVVEQPEARGMRFRYPSEGTCAGSLLGASSTDRDKTYPSVRLVNLTGKAEVQVCLVMRDAPHRPHPYSLVGRDCEDGIFKQIVVQGRTIVQLINVGIQCVKKAMVQRSAEDKIRKINPFKVSDRVVLRPEEMDLTAVRLCFQAKLLPSNQILPPVLSEIIFDKKATCASQLKITRMNKTYGSVHGGDEVMLFCEKVQKDDIRVIFSLAGWQAEGIFSTGDVHKQVAIVFKTPAFHDQGICAPVKVSIYLWRPSDQQQSNPHSFLYKPELDDAFGVERKRKQTPYQLQEFVNSGSMHAGASGPPAPTAPIAAPTKPSTPATRYSKRLSSSRGLNPRRAGGITATSPATPSPPISTPSPPDLFIGPGCTVTSTNTILNVTMSQGRILQVAPPPEAPFTDDQVAQIDEIFAQNTGPVSAVLAGDLATLRLTLDPAPAGVAMPVPSAEVAVEEEAARAAMDLALLEDVLPLEADDDHMAEHVLRELQEGRLHINYNDLMNIDENVPEQFVA